MPIPSLDGPYSYLKPDYYVVYAYLAGKRKIFLVTTYSVKLPLSYKFKSIKKLVKMCSHIPLFCEFSGFQQNPINLDRNVLILEFTVSAKYFPMQISHQVQLVMQIRRVDQQKASLFESDFCVSYA